MIRWEGIRKIAAEFWRAAGGRWPYGCPINIASAVITALKVPVIPIHGLTFERADEFLGRIGGPQTAPGGGRRLHGMIVADQDTAIIFVDGDDVEEEQRATIAHETAHFIRHYSEPRQRARQLLGHSIDDVLNRRRHPTSAERFAAVMRGVPLGCFRCSEPYDRGSFIGSASEIEEEANAIALELLAPRAQVERIGHCSEAVLMKKFGIPFRMAATAIRLTEPAHRGTTVVDIFRAGRATNAAASSHARPTRGRSSPESR
jgi:Zn-dependent peptidase ImmA (M78 family)